MRGTIASIIAVLLLTGCAWQASGPTSSADLGRVRHEHPVLPVEQERTPARVSSGPTDAEIIVGVTFAVLGFTALGLVVVQDLE